MERACMEIVQFVWDWFKYDPIECGLRLESLTLVFHWMPLLDLNYIVSFLSL